jgi:hypothetical protein
MFLLKGNAFEGLPFRHSISNNPGFLFVQQFLPLCRSSVPAGLPVYGGAI